MSQINKRAIVTVSIGDKGQSLFLISSPFLKGYSEKCEADFICIDTSKVNAGDPKFEKFQIYDVLEKYDQVLYFDVDVLITPSCPNLFNFVPPTLFGAYFDSNGGNGDAEDGFPDLRGEEIRSYQKTHGWIGWDETYFNSGVMVVDRTHREMFNYGTIPQRSSRFIDQTCLNYRLQKLGFSYIDIGQKFNHFAGFNRSPRLYRTRFSSYVIHYAGFSEFYPERNLLAQMRLDAERLNARPARLLSKE